ncbi:hypothetical protein KF913_09405 [Candidatus Obscuribacterales bacterium]|nr:hypothetical protein [Candidatus Obscuribacterales bacterium]
MNFDENRSAEEKAWAVACDPSASEKQWVAACTLLDGKQPITTHRKKLPQSVGLPWSLCVSGLSGLGAFMIFGLMSFGACEGISTLTGVFHSLSTPHAFSLLSAAFIAFSAVFTYQQHIWGGGRAWTALHYGLVTGGAILPLTELMTAPAALGTTGLLIWSLGFIGVSAISSKMTQNSIKALESSVGANRVVPYSRGIFATAGALLLTFIAVPIMFVIFSSIWVIIPGILLLSGYGIARANNAYNPQTAGTLALAAWNPVILANVILIPTLLVYSGLSLFLPLMPISLTDFAVGLLTLAAFGAGPFVGAQIGAFVQRRARELELHRTPLDLVAQTSPPSHLINADDSLCEPT